MPPVAECDRPPMMFELLLDVMNPFPEPARYQAEFAIALVTPSSNRCAPLRESHRTLRDGSFEMGPSQALRARLRSHRPSGTFGSYYSRMHFSPKWAPSFLRKANTN